MLERFAKKNRMSASMQFQSLTLASSPASGVIPVEYKEERVTQQAISK
jgi:hypothetical protein